MAPRREDVMKLCQVLSEEENLKVTVSQSLKGGLLCFTGAFAGSLLAGPVGLALGGSAAAAMAALSSRGKYKSVVEIIANMSEAQRKKLTDAVLKVLSGFHPEDFVALVMLIKGDMMLKGLVLQQIKSTLAQELSVQVV